MQNVRIPPQSMAAEKAVLGACLLNDSAIFSAMEFVRAADFYKKEHQVIFQTMLDLNSASYVCDLVAVSERLAKQGQLEMVGGVEYLASLTGEVPSLANAEYYSQIVADKATQRQLITAAQKVVDDGYQGHKDALELLGDAAAVIDRVGEQRLGSGVQEAALVMEREFNKLDDIKAHDGITGVPTFRDLDNRLSGLQKGDLIILAARPGCGKTSMAVNIAANAALLNNFEIVATSLIALCIFKEAVSARLWRAIILVTLSSMLLSVEDISGLHFSWGSLLVLLAAVFWGLENNCTRMLANKNTYEIVTLKGLGSGVGSLLIALTIGEALPRAPYILLTLLLGFVAYGLSIFCYIKAQNVLGAAKTSAYYAIAPFIGALFSFIFLQETPSPNYLPALMLMLAGTAIIIIDTLALTHTHRHTHTLISTHNGVTSRQTIRHEHPHSHILPNRKHNHRHRPAILPK